MPNILSNLPKLSWQEKDVIIATMGLHRDALGLLDRDTVFKVMKDKLEQGCPCSSCRDLFRGILEKLS